MERRELLKMIAAATGMAMIGLPAFAQGTSADGDSLFSEAQIAKLDAIAETILPRTDTPGAKDAGVGAFMARYVTDCYTPEEQALFRAGLAEIDTRAGGDCTAITPEARAELLRTLDTEARARADAIAAGEQTLTPHAFTMMKQLVIFSFFTSKVGATQVLRYVAVPGDYDGDMTYEPGTPAWATT